MLSRRGIIASAILRPVVEVLVGPGDRVTKGQALIKLYDLEPQAKVRAREKELRSIEAKSKYSRRILDLAERSRETGALPAITYNELSGTALSNEALVLAAQAELSLAQSELKLYTLTASIDGEIAWRCSVCKQKGVIRNWQGTKWDYTAEAAAAQLYGQGRPVSRLHLLLHQASPPQPGRTRYSALLQDHAAGRA